MSKKLTTEEFIEKALNIHGNRYDYSKVDYKGINENVCIICPEHGEFLQQAHYHLQGRGCWKCANEKNANLKILKAKDKFITEANKVHNDKYNYSKVEYKGAKIKVCIICPKHGEWWQTPGNHLSGFGCKGCANDIVSEKKSKSQEDFIREAKEIHGDRYDYSKTIYKGYHNRLCIICPEHGEFWQMPASHIYRKAGCPVCVGKKKEYPYNDRKRLTTESFIEKAKKVHADKYDYSKTIYGNNGKHKVIVICPKHGEFTIAPTKHLCGDGCRKCGIERTTQSKLLNTEIFIERSNKIHHNKYDYSKVKYVDQSTEVIIICPEHGEFKQQPMAHWRKGSIGCPECARKLSSLEEEIRFVIESTKSKFIEQQQFDWLKYKKKLRLDFYLPDHNIAIECQGGQHFKCINYFGGEDGFKKTLQRDIKKNKLCNENGIKIYYYLYDNVDKEEIINNPIFKGIYTNENCITNIEGFKLLLTNFNII